MHTPTMNRGPLLAILLLGLLAAASLAIGCADTDAPDADAVVWCDADRAPQMRGDVVIDPCGCCPLEPGDCGAAYYGGSPTSYGQCTRVNDAAPPCTEGVDARGCPYRSCSGSCLSR